MARYGEAFRNRTVARLLLPESGMPYEPSDAEVNELIAANNGGPATLDQTAAVLGVNRARAQQLVVAAVAKFKACLSG